MKTQNLGPFWAPFAHFQVNFFFLANPLLSLFSVSRFLLLNKISEKSYEQIFRKTGYRRTCV